MEHHHEDTPGGHVTMANVSCFSGHGVHRPQNISGERAHLVFMSGTDGELCSFIAPKFVLAAAIYTQMFQVEPRFPFAFPRVDKLTDFQRES